VQRIAVCASVAIPLAACGSSGESTTATSGAAITEVVVQNYVFPAITTTTGAQLRFVNRDDESHTVTADDGSFKVGPFDNKTPVVLVAPSTPGSFAFHCEIHPTMHGTLVVNNQ
jgi:plastocyanin